MLIRGGTIVTGDGRTSIAEGELLIRDGRIADVGRNLASHDNEVVDATGQIVLPGVINTHAHGCVRGPFVPVASPALSEAEVNRELDRHLLGGETTVLCVCGFCLPSEITGQHPLRVRLATSHTPANFAAADIVDGRGLTPQHRAMTVERALEEGAVAIGELGAGHSLGGGGQDYLYIPDVIERATGVRLRPDQARQLKWAVLGRSLSRDAFDAGETERCLNEFGLAATLSVEDARRMIERSVLPSIETTLEGFEEAAALSAKTGARAVFHNSPVSVGTIAALAKKYPAAKLVAGHSNQGDFTPEEAIAWAKKTARARRHRRHFDLGYSGSRHPGQAGQFPAHAGGESRRHRIDRLTPAATGNRSSKASTWPCDATPSISPRPWLWRRPTLPICFPRLPKGADCSLREKLPT